MGIQKHVAGQIEELAEEDPGFAVLHVPLGWGHETQRPVLILVHPGDAVELSSDWAPDQGEIRQRVMATAAANQMGMAREIQDRLESHHVVVLHRQSSLHLNAHEVDVGYGLAVQSIDQAGAVLFGDDLDEAARWLLEHCPALHWPGAQVFMTGAYADAQHGCITALGKGIQQAIEGVGIEVSVHAPTDNLREAPRWDPQALSPRQMPRP